MDYIDNVAGQIDKLTTHSYISKSQANYLRNKISLPEDEIIILVDFAENYAFVVQNEVQGFHWNKSQCTLHPAVIYYKSRKDGRLELTSHYSLHYFNCY